MAEGPAGYTVGAVGAKGLAGYTVGYTAGYTVGAVGEDGACTRMCMLVLVFGVRRSWCFFGTAAMLMLFGFAAVWTEDVCAVANQSPAGQVVGAGQYRALCTCFWSAGSCFWENLPYLAYRAGQKQRHPLADAVCGAGLCVHGSCLSVCLLHAGRTQPAQCLHLHMCVPLPQHMPVALVCMCGRVLQRYPCAEGVHEGSGHQRGRGSAAPPHPCSVQHFGCGHALLLHLCGACIPA